MTGRRLFGLLSALLMFHLSVAPALLSCEPQSAHCAGMPRTHHPAPPHSDVPSDCCIALASCASALLAPAPMVQVSTDVRQVVVVGGPTERPTVRLPAPEPPPPKR